jgi:hypothetical protein
MINLFYWLHLQHVTQMKTLRAFLAAAFKDFEVHKLHVKTEFLNGDIEEELDLKQPPGYKIFSDQCKHKACLQRDLRSGMCTLPQLEFGVVLPGHCPMTQAASTSEPCFSPIANLGRLTITQLNR